MKKLPETDEVPLSPGGAPILSCDLDDNCAEVDCEALLPDVPDSLSDNAVAPEYLAHYCGLDYVARHQKHPSGDDDNDGQ